MKDFFLHLVTSVKRSIERFFTTFMLTVLLFITSGYIVIFEPSGVFSDTMIKIALSISFGILFCTLGKLLFEKYCEPILLKKRILIEIGLVLLSMLSYPFVKNFQENPYVSARYFGIMFALFVSIFYVANVGNIAMSFPYLFKNTVFNALVCLIVLFGTSLSIFAFNTLIYEFENSHKIYLVNSLFIWIILFMNLSLSTIPCKNQELKIPKLFMIIVMYVALPVYLLLITILYLYLGKIMITFRFPSGQINWFASFSSLLFTFFLFSLEQYKEENKLAKIFVKYGGYVIIPIIVMQFVAMYIRFSNYGLTTSRYVSLVLNIIALTFMVVSFIKDGKYIKHMLFVVAGASLLLTATPLNLFDIPLWEQTTRLTNVLQKNHMITDGKIIPKGDIPDSDKIKITSAFNYIERSYAYSEKHEIPDIIKNTNRTDFLLMFGFSQTYEENEASYSDDNYGDYTYQYDFLNIESYRKLYTISTSNYDNKRIKNIRINNSKKTIDITVITKEIETLYSQYGKGTHDVKMEFPINGDVLILTSVHFVIEQNNQLHINWIDGYFLEK